jgi:threonine aldolase
MASRLAEGMSGLGYQLRFPTEANAVFVVLDPRQDAALRDRGYTWYPFGDPGWNMFRIMCSFDTQPEHVDAILADAQAVADR